MGGTVRLDVPSGTVDVSVENLAAISMSLDGVANVSNLFVHVLASFNLSSASVPRIRPKVSGAVVIRLLNNLATSFRGSLDLDAGWATLDLDPVLNWSPLPAPFAPSFTIPSFAGGLTLGVAGMRFSFLGEVTLPTVNLSAGFLSLAGIPELGLSGPRCATCGSNLPQPCAARAWPSRDPCPSVLAAAG